MKRPGNQIRAASTVVGNQLSLLRAPVNAKRLLPPLRKGDTQPGLASCASTPYHAKKDPRKRWGGVEFPHSQER